MLRLRLPEPGRVVEAHDLHKGSRRNNFPFSHPIFGPSSADPRPSALHYFLARPVSQLRWQKGGDRIVDRAQYGHAECAGSEHVPGQCSPLSDVPPSLPEQKGRGQHRPSDMNDEDAGHQTHKTRGSVHFGLFDCQRLRSPDRGDVSVQCNGLTPATARVPKTPSKMMGEVHGSRDASEIPIPACVSR